MSIEPKDRGLVGIHEEIPRVRILYVAVPTSPSKNRSQQGYHVKVPARPAGFLRQQWHTKSSCDIRGSLDRQHSSYRRSIKARQFGQDERYHRVEIRFRHQRDTHTYFSSGCACITRI